MVRYEVPARIHITLYDMNGNLGRMNGSLGFAIDSPKLVFYIEKSENIEVIEKNAEVKSNEQREYIYKELMNLKKLYNLHGAKIIIESIIPEHMGFGSKSITKMSIARAYLELYNKKIDNEELAVLLRRGGTSGISVNIIDKGGFIFDGGRKKKEHLQFRPSSAQEKIEVPPIIFHRKMIETPIYILIPNDKGLYDKKEIDFFTKVCPIKEKSVEKLARVINSQILPSICENDLDILCDGINRIQHLEWKKKEINMYSKQYRKFIYHLQKKGYGCGMSSTGPVIYVIGNNLNSLQREIEKSTIEFKKVILTHANNEGIKRYEVNGIFNNR